MLAEGQSPKAMGYGVSLKTARKWVAGFRAEGSGGDASTMAASQARACSTSECGGNAK